MSVCVEGEAGGDGDKAAETKSLTIYPSRVRFVGAQLNKFEAAMAHDPLLASSRTSSAKS